MLLTWPRLIGVMMKKHDSDEDILVSVDADGGMVESPSISSSGSEKSSDHLNKSSDQLGLQNATSTEQLGLPANILSTNSSLSRWWLWWFRWWWWWWWWWWCRWYTSGKQLVDYLLSHQPPHVDQFDIAPKQDREHRAKQCRRGLIISQQNE